MQDYMIEFDALGLLNGGLFLIDELEKISDNAHSMVNGHIALSRSWSSKLCKSLS